MTNTNTNTNTTARDAAAATPPAQALARVLTQIATTYMRASYAPDDLVEVLDRAEARALLALEEIGRAFEGALDSVRHDSPRGDAARDAFEEVADAVAFGELVAEVQRDDHADVIADLEPAPDADAVAECEAAADLDALRADVATARETWSAAKGQRFAGSWDSYAAPLAAALDALGVALDREADAAHKRAQRLGDFADVQGDRLRLESHHAHAEAEVYTLTTSLDRARAAEVEAFEAWECGEGVTDADYRATEERLRAAQEATRLALAALIEARHHRASLAPLS